MVLKKMLAELLKMPSYVEKGATYLAEKAIDSHINLGVTGLSHSGKTVFITALVDNLINPRRLETHFGHRELAAQIIAQQHYEVLSFPYEKNIAIMRDQTMPKWPEPTDTISEICLQISYKNRRGKRSCKFLNIVDYPGEWLTDLPLLSLSYEQWSQQVKARLNKSEAGLRWVELGRNLKPGNNFEAKNIASVVVAYKEWLFDSKKLGLSLIQPGRFIQPGDLQGAPMLEFVPWVWDGIEGQESEGLLIKELANRFEAYKTNVVRVFYEKHFRTLDRQIVLVDCLTALKNGEDSIYDLVEAIKVLAENYSYGRLSFFKRLFKFVPKIDRIVFAATKADNILQEEHEALAELLKFIVKSAHNQAMMENVQLKYIPLAAVKTTTEVEEQNHDGSIWRGLMIDGERAVRPKSIPILLTPSSIEEFAVNFKMLKLPPPSDCPLNKPLPDLNLGQAISFLIGDKLP